MSVAAVQPTTLISTDPGSLLSELGSGSDDAMGHTDVDIKSDVDMAMDPFDADADVRRTSNDSMDDTTKSESMEPEPLSLVARREAMQIANKAIHDTMFEAPGRSLHCSAYNLDF